MQNDAATLYCPNDLCQAPNHQTDKFCQRCDTPLIKRYLWAVGEGIEADKPGALWLDRYLLKRNRIFLDTKPAIPPQTPNSEISDQIKHYLRLIPYRLHVPQVYALIPNDQGNAEILLLEQGPIYEAMPLEGQLMPQLTHAWKEAKSMRQMNWLWQMASLWQPLESEGVASSLLKLKLLRVEGSLVRLSELHLDRTAPTLTQLGQLWLQLVPEAQPAIASFLEQVCRYLVQGEVRSSEQLLTLLDRGLAELGRSQTISISIATRTDTGPSRQRNEDACYPPSSNTITKPPETAAALAIVCDGIGGHEGGSIASTLAVETIQQHLELPMSIADTYLEPINVIGNLERATYDANDQISLRNDKEHRHGRQRMGTTLVMALAHAHEIYIAHVGDSRAYWITPIGAHQVTLDDDVACREVRLGYALYRDALQQPSSGSLVQALGMGASTSLHPTVQRFVLDEDAVFLLCSDGLSDYDRVEQCWETEILPILDGKVDVATAAARLVELANDQNGHDNVTVCLIYCQVSSSEPPLVSTSLIQENSALDVDTDEPEVTVPGVKPQNNNNAAPSTLQTEFLPAPSSARFPFVPVIVGIVLVLGLGGLVAYWHLPTVRGWVDALIHSSPNLDNTKPTSTLSPPSPVPSPTASQTSIVSPSPLVEQKRR